MEGCNVRIDEEKSSFVKDIEKWPYETAPNVIFGLALG